MEKRRVLVCGASQGIGLATARELAAVGHRVTLFSRSEEKLRKGMEGLSGDGHDILCGDIGKPETWYSELASRHGDSGYSMIVCNSGGPAGGKISQAAPEDFLEAMNAHVVANSRLVKLCLEFMGGQKFGRIITVTSTSVKVPIPHLGVSNTARAAVASWAKTLSLEVAPLGITVNNVMPGFTETPRLAKLIQAKAKASGLTADAVETQWKAMVPMGRFCQPEETAKLIGFLCSEHAGAITGQNIAVDGGRVGCL